MNRRSLIARAIGKKSTQSEAQSNVVAKNTLAPYMGDWTRQTAVHLLKRTTFGPTLQSIDDSHQKGLEGTLSELFADKPLPSLPINYIADDDPTTPIGESWVGKPLDQSIPNLNTSRNVSLNAWQMGLFNEGGTSIREKLVLFWHNHFVTSDLNFAGLRFNYLDILRRNALGNFRTITEEITVSPSMLIYLNGDKNRRQAPNENYSRELLELFTIGKGDAAGPGDYTNYTEDDVIALAKSLTGWRVTNEEGIVGSEFVSNRHDTNDKQLSHRFDNVVIQNGGENEYKTVIDIILRQEETARFICRRLYIWFVGSDIDANIETNIIEPMAALIRENNYEMKPAIEALLRSEHFYDESIRGCMVNHPIDFIFKMINSFEIETPNNILTKYRVWTEIYRTLLPLEMIILQHPSVAGWKAFYQGPQFYNVWANSFSLPFRERIITALIDGVMVGQHQIKIDTLSLVSKFDNALDPTQLIVELTNFIFCFPISANQIDYLKEILIPGLPDFEWSVEYSDYLSNPDDDDKRLAIENKLAALFTAALKMPENYLI